MSKIVVGSSLPPQVEGQLRCFLSAKAKTLDWSIPTPPKDVQVCVHWWGEGGEGSTLRPKVESDPSYVASDKVSEIHYPIRCGPRQFNSYIQDMGLLHFDVVFGPSKTKFAKVEVKSIGQLTASKPLHGTYPVISVISPYKSKQIGTLVLSIAFKTTSDTYNVSSSIVPTTDKEFVGTPNSKEKSTKKKKSVKKKDKHVHYSKKSPERISYAGRTATSKENDISFVVGPGARRNFQQKEKQDDSAEIKLNELNDDSFHIISGNNEFERSDGGSDGNNNDDLEAQLETRKPSEIPSKSDTRVGAVVLKGEGGSNILSLLLEKGEKLREDMVMSQVNGIIKCKEIESPHKNSRESVVGALGEALVSHSKNQSNRNIERRAVELLIGDEEEELGEKTLRRFSISSDGMDEISELSDPLHDSSLLSELFYNTKSKNGKAEESSIIFTEDDTTLSAASPRAQQRITEKKFQEKEIVMSEESIIDSFENADLASTKIENDDSVESEFNYKKLLPDSLSVEKLTVLGRVKSSKVTIAEMSLNESQRLGSVYFIEYSFPVTALDSSDTSLAVETVCNVSKCVDSRNGIPFGRISIFPLCFNEEMVNHWWNRSVRFKCFVKFNRQHKQTFFGEGDLKLRSVLLSENLSSTVTVGIYNDESGVGNAEPVGEIKVYVNLIFDQTGHTKSSFAKLNAKSQQQPIPVKLQQQKHKTTTYHHHQARSIVAKDQPKTISAKPTETIKERQTSWSNHSMLLESLLSISEGKGIYLQSEEGASHLYCVSRVFWSKENGQTKICWNTNDPYFQFQQIIPVEFTEETTKKMKRNLMIIEVWNKSTSTNKDKLVGMGKISLNQYFLSFKNEHFSDTLLKSQYPVISIDDWIPVVDVISGQSRGHLKVIHAVGTSDQIMRLLAMKGNHSAPRNRNQNNNADQRSIIGSNTEQPANTRLVEHCMEITIESVKNIFQANGSSEVWGESDCYVQYHFPQQQQQQQQQQHQSAASFECFKTKTTLYVPNLIFNHQNKHSFLLSPSTPVQSVFAQSGNGDEIEFELWKRHYYPNIREELIAKCFLPLVKLTALATMHTEGGVSSQSYGLPLSSLDVSHQEDTRCCGTLNLFVSYNKQVSFSAKKEVADMIGLSISILRMCSLKTCAKTRTVNSYVRFYLSPFKDSTARETHVVAGSFCPTFSYHSEFPVPISKRNRVGQVISLVELLESGNLICKVYHQKNADNAKDALLASGEIPLRDLLSKSNGIRRWFALTKPKAKNYHHATTAGIEIQIKFSNHEDRRNIINLGRSVGWLPNQDIELNNEAWLSPQYSEQLPMACQIDIFIDKVWVPGHVVEDCFPCYKELKRTTNHYLYARYKFYDKAPFVTTPRKLKMDDGEDYVAVCKEKKHFQVSPTTSFAWYLHEEVLEIQFWISLSGKVAKPTPGSNDRLVGSSYVALKKFSHSPFESNTVSELCPLFKSDSANVCDASARVYILSNQHTTSKGNLFDETLRTEEEDDENSLETSTSDEESLLNNICTQTSRAKLQEQLNQTKPSSKTNVVIDQKNVSVCVQVEEALHLPKFLSGEEHQEPDTYVTFQLQGQPSVETNISCRSVKPKWNFRQEITTNFEHLRETFLEFIVWRCTGPSANKERDLQIGIAKIDTSPLFYGMKQINGWYNIHNFNDRCCGQLKVAVVPATQLSPSRSAKYFKKYEMAEPVNLDFAFFSKSIIHCSQQPTKQDENTSSKLFEQLRQNLFELDEMTHNIKRRTQRPDTLRRNENTETWEQGKREKDNISTESTFVDNHVLSSGHVADLVDETGSQSYSSSSKETYVIEQEGSELFASDHNSIRDEIIDYPGCEFEHHVVTAASNEPSVGNSDDSHDGNDDLVLAETPPATESLNDSTDDLLEHLREFEKKYKHLKNIVQNDSDFDDERDSPSFSSPRGDINHQKSAFFDGDDGPVVVDSFFGDEVVNVSSGEPSKEDDVRIMDNNDLKTKDFSPQTNGSLSGDSNIVGNENPPVTLPNFFMKPQELAESMRTLRIAANFRNSPRVSPRTTPRASDTATSTKTPTTPTTTSTSTTAAATHKEELQRMLRGQQVSIEPTEMARIASIFSSK